MPIDLENSATMWVCTDCMFVHANGECDPDRPADLPEPWALLENDPGEVAMGLLRDEHTEDCPNRTAQWGADECDCATNSFSWSYCEGCGTHLGGERHAFTYWPAV